MKQMAMLFAAVAILAQILPAQAARSGSSFQAYGNQEDLSASAVNCLAIRIDCTLSLGGSVIGGSLKGSISSVIRVYGHSTATPNGSGGFCAHFKGQSTMFVAGIVGESLRLLVEGTVCGDGAASATSGHTFTGAYAIAGGKSSFLGSTGVGSFNMNENGKGTFEYNFEGSFLPGPEQ